MMTLGFTVAGFVFVGIVIGGVAGYFVGKIRKRNGKSKKWTAEVIHYGRIKELEYSILGAGYGQHAYGIPCSYFYKSK